MWLNAEGGKRVLNMQLVEGLAKEPIMGDNDLCSASSLILAICGECESYGTDGIRVTINLEQLHDTLIFLKKVLRRHGVQFCPPGAVLHRSGSIGWLITVTGVGKHVAQ